MEHDDLHLDYEALPDFHDEMLDRSGQPRAHWLPLVGMLQSLGRDELVRRWESAQRLIRENGVTYNVYEDPRGLHRPWELDPFPLVIASEEWRTLQEGLAQRARLLEAILQDVYGPQRLLHDDLLPPELIFAHPTYLRACRGAQPRGGRWLHLYAADLGRSPDGQWWTLADRTQAPSGMGYALENRIVLSRTLPEAFRESRVERVAQFFQCMRDTLRSLSPRPLDEPRMALLTPGPWNETYFEHAYLARYLGLTLVEGADLTVRDRALYLKTLGGLERIDVLLRRVDDVFCDPLSLRSDSTLGVAGLVHSMRAGHVAVMNALGSGLVESAALLAFLPRLCRELLGEELQLPSVATWWCGEPEALKYALEHLDTLVIKPTFPGAGREPVFAGHMCGADRSALVASLKAQPRSFVAQEQVALSTAPVWNGEHAEARHVGLRTYAVVAPDGRWHVMPGGLARAAIARDSLVISMQRGGGSKDVWIRSEGTPAALSLLRPAVVPVELRRGGAELPSRVADDLFWLGRYVERVEGMTRILRSVVRVLADERTGTSVEIGPLLASLASQAGASGQLRGRGRMLEESISHFLFVDEGSALRSSLRSIHQLAFSLRDQLSLDTWRLLSELQLDLAVRAPGLDAARAALNRMIMHLAGWSGLVMESMTRTLGWRFAEMGRRIERATYMSKLLTSSLVAVVPDEPSLLEILLETAESVITYRRRYRGELQVEPVLDLLLSDESNPRSVAFQLAALGEHVGALPVSGEGARLRPEARIVLGMLTRLRLAEVRELAQVADGKRLRLEEVLTRTAEDLPALSDALTRSYLSHTGEVRRTERF